MTNIKKLSSQPWCPAGFKIISNEPMKSFDPSLLSIHLEPEQENGYLKNETIIDRMKGKGLNSNVLKYLLDHPAFIPNDWKKRWGVFFDGTILESPYGDRYSLSLYWHGGRWRWYCAWLDDGRRVNDPSAVLQQVSPKPSKSQSSLSLDLSPSEHKALKSVLTKLLK